MTTHPAKSNVATLPMQQQPLTQMPPNLDFTVVNPTQAAERKYSSNHPPPQYNPSMVRVNMIVRETAPP